MAFKARDSKGGSHHAFSVTREQGPFFCQVCQGAMTLVAPKIRTRPHFRHQVESNCAWEPETPDHENAKLAVCDAINTLGLGQAEVEMPVGKWIADVLWTYRGHRVAFEIQRANYPWAKFNEKLNGYRAESVAVVYLFIGPQFFRENDGEYRLKDIELRLLSGSEEPRSSPHWNGNTTGLMETRRVYAEYLGLVASAYLRRKPLSRDALMVREPVFYSMHSDGQFRNLDGEKVETITQIATQAQRWCYLIPKVVEILKPLSDLAFTFDLESLRDTAPGLGDVRRPPASTKFGVCRYEAWRLRPASDGAGAFVSIAVVADNSGLEDSLGQIEGLIGEWRDALKAAR